MRARDLPLWFLCLATVCLVPLSACLNNASVPPLSPPAQGVRVDSGNPPPGARLIGPVSATHGKGCGIVNQRGTEEGATAALREAAAQRGATFVKITKTIKPYPGHDCFHQEFTLEGLAYSMNELKPAAPAAVSAPPPVVSAPSATTFPSPAASASTPPLECAPPCSPGYTCHAGVCEAACNPPCAPDQTCRADRVCVARPGPG